MKRETKSSKSSKPVLEPGKFTDNFFISFDARSFLPAIVTKSILPQRNLDVKDFKKKKNLLPLLHSNNLFKSVILPALM